MHHPRHADRSSPPARTRCSPDPPSDARPARLRLALLIGVELFHSRSTPSPQLACSVRLGSRPLRPPSMFGSAIARRLAVVTRLVSSPHAMPASGVSHTPLALPPP